MNNVKIRKIILIAIVALCLSYFILQLSNTEDVIAEAEEATERGDINAGDSSIRAMRTTKPSPHYDTRKRQPEYKEGEVLVGFKEGVDPHQVISNTSFSAASIQRIHSIKPAVKKFLKEYKLERDSKGWYWFLGKSYKEIEKIPDEEAFKQAYQKMSPEEKALYRSYKITLPENITVEEAIEELKKDPNVEYAQPNYLYKMHIPPSDPYYYDETQSDGRARGAWGQGYEDLWGLYIIENESAWDTFDKYPLDRTPGCESAGEDVIVAVIDTGVDYTHPDLADNIWINQEELKISGSNYPAGLDIDRNGTVSGSEVLSYISDYNADGVVNLEDLISYSGGNPFTNYVDEDNNGYVDDLLGWDFSGNDPEYYIIPDNDPSDYYGHGTHCAGTIAAIGNNSEGVLGVAPKAKIMPVKIFPYAADDVIVSAIVYAARNGAKVLSNSWGPIGKRPSDPTLEGAVDYAYDDYGCVVVFSAGNDNKDVANYSPANYSKTIAVAATDYQDRKARFSNYGSLIDVSAPGMDILSLRAYGTDMYYDPILNPGYRPGQNFVPPFDPNAKYYRSDGTSMACPHVSGLAALVMSANSDYTNAEVRQRIVATGDNIDNQNPDFGGWLGRGINAYNALNPDHPIIPKVLYLTHQIDDSNSGNGNGGIEQGETIELYITLKNREDTTVNSVNASLSTEDPYVVVNTAYAVSFGDIGPGEEAEGLFQFQVLQAKPYLEPIVFSLEINSGETSLASQTFIVETNIMAFAVSELTEFAPDIYANNVVWVVDNYPDQYTYDIYLSNAGNLIDAGSEEEWSPALPAVYGDKIAWARENGFIYIYDISNNRVMENPIDTTSREKLYLPIPNIYVDEGNKRIVWSEELDQGGMYKHDIYLYDDTTGQRAINSTNNSYQQYYESRPAIYGNNIVWHESTGESRNYDIYIYDISTDTKTLLTPDTEDSDQLYPAIFNNKIVWTNDRNGSTDIYMYDLSSDMQHRITTYSSYKLYPAVYEDAGGNAIIVWQDNRNGNWDIYMYDVSAVEEKRITTHRSDQYFPAIHGGKIAWTDERNGNCDIYMTILNNLPVADDQSVTTDEDTQKAITITATDEDDDTLTYTIVTNPSHGSLTGTAPDLTYIPDSNYYGDDSFTFKANDGVSDSNIATVSITVNPVDDVPIANDQSVTTDEDTSKTIVLNVTEHDGDSLTYNILTNPSDGSLTETAPNLTYTPDSNYYGDDSFTFKANDGVSDSNIATVTITVVSINDAPVADGQNITTDEDSSKAIILTAADIEGDTLTYSILTNPSHGNLTGTTPDLTYTPDSNYYGDDSFTFKANDGVSDSNIATVSITINPVDDLPIANDQSVTTDKNVAKAITLDVTEYDGDTLTYSFLTSPSHGTLTGTAPNLTYTPDFNYSGSDSFTFKANDGKSDSNIATVTITITYINYIPAADDQSLTINKNTSKTITLTATDPDRGTLTYIIVTDPSHGSLTGTAPNLTYTPDFNYKGTDSFTFKVNDGEDDSNTATISIIIGVTADFTAIPLEGDAPLTVNFKDCSTGNIMSRLWNFGDRESSTAKEPSHVYSEAETYTVSLNISGINDSDTKTKGNYVKVTEPTQEPPPDTGDDTFDDSDRSLPPYGTFLKEYPSGEEEDITEPGADEACRKTKDIEGAGEPEVDTGQQPDSVQPDEGPYYEEEMETEIPPEGEYTYKKFTDTKRATKRQMIGRPAEPLAPIEDESIEKYKVINPPPVFAPIEDRFIRQGKELTIALVAKDPGGDPLTFLVDSLPRGASLDGNLFKWRPDFKTSGDYEVVFMVTDGEHEIIKTITINVKKANFISKISFYIMEGWNRLLTWLEKIRFR